MYSIRAKYSVPVENGISDQVLLSNLVEINDEWFVKTFKKYSDHYKDREDYVSIASELTNLMNFLNNEIKDSEKVQLSYLEQIISWQTFHENEKLNDKFKLIFKGLLGFKRIYDMTLEPIHVFKKFKDAGIPVTDNVLKLFEFIEFVIFANTHLRQISGIPKKFQDLKILYLLDLKLILEQRENINHQLNRDILNNIILHFFETPNSGLPIYFDDLELAAYANSSPNQVGRARFEKFSAEKISAYVNEFLNNNSYPNPQKYWHTGNVQKGALNISELAKYILFKKFEATEDEFSLGSMENRIEEVLPKKYLPSYRKQMNRKKK